VLATLASSFFSSCIGSFGGDVATGMDNATLGGRGGGSSGISKDGDVTATVSVSVTGSGSGAVGVATGALTAAACSGSGSSLIFGSGISSPSDGGSIVDDTCSIRY